MRTGRMRTHATTRVRDRESSEVVTDGATDRRSACGAVPNGAAEASQRR